MFRIYIGFGVSGYMSYSLNSSNGVFIGDNMGE